jgi:hypothetical protein
MDNNDSKTAENNRSAYHFSSSFMVSDVENNESNSFLNISQASQRKSPRKKKLKNIKKFTEARKELLEGINSSFFTKNLSVKDYTESKKILRPKFIKYFN